MSFLKYVRREKLLSEKGSRIKMRKLVSYFLGFGKKNKQDTNEESPVKNPPTKVTRETSAEDDYLIFLSGITKKSLSEKQQKKQKEVSK